MNVYSIFDRVSPVFRRRRMELFRHKMTPTENTRILDVGGYPWFWRDSGIKSRITILNLHVLPGLVDEFKDRYQLVTGDGTRLEYKDSEFDIVVSNSVIEHLKTYESQEKFAKEVRRVGKELWIQTPAKSFFLEPHLLTPFFHWLPRKTRFRITRYFTVWGWITRPSKQEAFEYVDQLRLLSRSEMKVLFPDCEILEEKVFGLTKSFIAVRRLSKQGDTANASS